MAESSTEERALSLSTLNLLGVSRDSIGIDAPKLCSILANNATSTSLPQTLFYLHDALEFLGCQSGPVDEKILSAELDYKPSDYYYLLKLATLTKSKYDHLVPKDWFKKFDAVLSDFEKAYLNLLACSYKSVDGTKSDSVATDLVGAMDSAGQTYEDFDLFSLSFSAAATCNFAAIDESTFTSAIDIIEKNRHFLGVRSIRSYFEVYSLINSSGLVQLSLAVYPRFDQNDGKMIVAIASWNKLNSLSSSHYAILQKIEDVVCDGKSVTNYELEKTPSYSLKFDAPYSECSFKVTFAPSQPFKLLNPSLVTTVQFFKPLALIDVNVEILRAEETRKTRKTITPFTNLSDLFHKPLKFFKIDFVISRNNERIRPHQVFLNLKHESWPHLASFVAQADDSDRYVCEIDVVGSADETFNYRSGSYKMELVIGEMEADNTIVWEMANVLVQFSRTPSVHIAEHDQQLMPEAQNVPKVLFKQPPFIISLMFLTVLLGLVAVLVLMWSSLELNLSLQLSISRLVFYLGCVGVTYTCYCYWSYMNGFEAIQYYVVASAVSCLALSYALDIKTNI